MSTQRRIPIKSRAAMLASLIDARGRLEKWREEGKETAPFALLANREQIARIMSTAPSGSGIDAGTALIEDRCNASRLAFEFSYHFMNDGGFYDGWQDYQLSVRPAFDGLDLKISGLNRDQIKDYLYETYQEWLSTPAVEVWKVGGGYSIPNPPTCLEIDPEMGTAFAVWQEED